MQLHIERLSFPLTSQLNLSNIVVFHVFTTNGEGFHIFNIFNNLFPLQTYFLPH